MTRRAVLVGTYRPENEAWIALERLCNLPMPKFWNRSPKERKGRGKR